MHETLRERAANPDTSLTDLQMLAQNYPALRPIIAQNPSTYPALLTWLATFGDPATDAALARRQTYISEAEKITTNGVGGVLAADRDADLDLGQRSAREILADTGMETAAIPVVNADSTLVSAPVATDSNRNMGPLPMLGRTTIPSLEHTEADNLDDIDPDQPETAVLVHADYPDTKENVSDAAATVPTIISPDDTEADQAPESATKTTIAGGSSAAVAAGVAGVNGAAGAVEVDTVAGAASAATRENTGSTGDTAAASSAGGAKKSRLPATKVILAAVICGIAVLSLGIGIWAYINGGSAKKLVNSQGSSFAPGDKATPLTPEQLKEKEAADKKAKEAAEAAAKKAKEAADKKAKEIADNKVTFVSRQVIGAPPNVNNIGKGIPAGAQALGNFSSAQGNIACAMSAGGVTCQIVNYNFDSGCNDNTLRITIGEGNQMVPSCIEGKFTERFQTLVAGSTTAASPFACTAEGENGMNCWNSTSGWGFTMSAAGVRQYSPSQ